MLKLKTKGTFLNKRKESVSVGQNIKVVKE